MGSKTYEGVRFSVYSNDHAPPHVHGICSGVSVIIDIFSDGTVRLSKRRKAIVPATAKRNIEAKIRRVALANADALLMLWEEMHGKVD